MTTPAKRAPLELTNRERPRGDKPERVGRDDAPSGVRPCMVCRAHHGPIGELLGCLEGEVLRLREELARR